MPALADDDVVMHGNAQWRGDVDDRLGHLGIGLLLVVGERRLAGEYLGMTGNGVMLAVRCRPPLALYDAQSLMTGATISNLCRASAGSTSLARLVFASSSISMASARFTALSRRLP